MASRWISARTFIARAAFEHAAVPVVDLVEKKLTEDLRREAGDAEVIEKTQSEKRLTAKYEPWKPGQNEWAFIEITAVWCIDGGPLKVTLPNP